MKASRLQDHRTNQSLFRTRRKRLSRRVKACVDQHFADVMAGKARLKSPAALISEALADGIFEELFQVHPGGKK